MSDELKIEQCDIDRAADFLESWEPGPEMTVVKLARAFCRHRREASRPSEDNCQLCKGANGGVPGNENRLPNGLVVCDYCHAALLKHRPPSPKPEV